VTDRETLRLEAVRTLYAARRAKRAALAALCEIERRTVGLEIDWATGSVTVAAHSGNVIPFKRRSKP